MDHFRRTVNKTAPAILEQLDVITDETRCFKSQENSTMYFTDEMKCLRMRMCRSHDRPDYDNEPHCNVTWDGLSCWPPVDAGSIATIPCFYEFNGVLYDTFENASRYCGENASWATRSDYSNCKPILEEELHIKERIQLAIVTVTPQMLKNSWREIKYRLDILRTTNGAHVQLATLKVLWDIKEAGTIYYVGYGVSLLALIAALYIFLHFKNLRCLRNNIHTNLLATYFFLDLTWIVTATLQSLPSVGESKVLLNVTCLLVVFLTYLMVTNFFWMFVEGLYLYILAVKTFSIEVVRMPVYALIGWGLPAIIVVTWACIKLYYAPMPKDPPIDDCTWQTKDSTDYIFICPIILVLVVNIFFMCKIMWVLITKLRIATSAESKQYRKAAKALLVLIPLLGMTYVLVIVTPTHRTARVIMSYMQAVLLSTQGFTVAILYCFLNGEVQKSVRHVWRRWSTRRTVHGSQRYSLSYRSSQIERDNMKLYRNTRGTQNRGSSASFSTCATTAATTSNWQANCSRCNN